MPDLAALRARFPDWNVRQDPDPDCGACKGTGVIEKTLSTGRDFEGPCACAVMSMPHGEEKRALMKEIGAAAGRILKRDFGHG